MDKNNNSTLMVHQNRCKIRRDPSDSTERRGRIIYETIVHVKHQGAEPEKAIDQQSISTASKLKKKKKHIPPIVDSLRL